MVQKPRGFAYVLEHLRDQFEAEFTSENQRQRAGGLLQTRIQAPNKSVTSFVEDGLDYA